MSDPFDLSGRVALITGGGRGLGREMAEAFAARGADLMIASRKPDVLTTAAQEISEQTGRRVVPFACHVGDWSQVDALAEAAYGEFGRVDILVNNAGMSPLYPTPSSVSEELWRKVMDVNLTGPWRLSAVVGERMKAAGRGSIINVSSTASLRPSPGEMPYGAAKAGINNLTASFAQALAPEVRVNCLMPGPFGTDISDAWTPEMRDRMERSIPLRRIGEPSEVIGPALLLASDAGSYLTGAVLRLDGGMSGVAGNG